MSAPAPDEQTQDQASQPSSTAAATPETPETSKATEAVDTKGPVDGTVPDEVDEYAEQRGGYGVSLETG